MDVPMNDTQFEGYFNLKQKLLLFWTQRQIQTVKYQLIICSGIRKIKL